MRLRSALRENPVAAAAGGAVEAGVVEVVVEAVVVEAADLAAGKREQVTTLP